MRCVLRCYTPPPEPAQGRHHEERARSLAARVPRGPCRRSCRTSTGARFARRHRRDDAARPEALSRSRAALNPTICSSSRTVLGTRSSRSQQSLQDPPERRLDHRDDPDRIDPWQRHHLRTWRVVDRFDQDDRSGHTAEDIEGGPEDREDVEVVGDTRIGLLRHDYADLDTVRRARAEMGGRELLDGGPGVRKAVPDGARIGRDRPIDSGARGADARTRMGRRGGSGAWTRMPGQFSSSIRPTARLSRRFS